MNGRFFIMDEKENMKVKAGMEDLRCVPALVGLSSMAIVRGVYGMLVTLFRECAWFVWGIHNSDGHSVTGTTCSNLLRRNWGQL